MSEHITQEWKDKIRQSQDDLETGSYKIFNSMEDAIKDLEKLVNTNVRKIVINRSYGGFDLSKEAWEAFGKENPKREDMFTVAFRTDPDLIRVVEELGERANGGYFSFAKSDLKIIEIPAGIPIIIEIYEGKEWVAEQHRVWGRD